MRLRSFNFYEKAPLPKISPKVDLFTRSFDEDALTKVKVATKAHKGKNPFTGEEMQFKAKPARNVVRIKPLKNLKSMV